MNALLLSVFVALSSVLPVMSYAQDTLPSRGEGDADDFAASGVAVSPSSLRFNVKPGSTQTQEVRVTNDTKKTYKFRLGYSDFRMSRIGRPEAAKPGEHKYSLSRWVSATPSYFELEPGMQQKITVTVSLPGNDSLRIAAWTILMIDQVTERQPLDAASSSSSAVALGITPSFGFGVYLYQNPPNVEVHNVEIEAFEYRDTSGRKQLRMEVRNTGDGIGFCTSYAELTHLATGKQTQLQVKQFTILPGFYRDFTYDLPADLPKGQYSVVGVVDLGAKHDIKAAELDLNIQ